MVSVFGSLNKKQKQDVIDAAAKEAAKLFKTYKQELITSILEFKALPDVQKLEMYRARTEDVWAAVQEFSPKLHEQQLSEWQLMEEQSMHRATSPWNPFQPKSASTAYQPGDLNG